MYTYIHHVHVTVFKQIHNKAHNHIKTKAKTLKFTRIMQNTKELKIPIQKLVWIDLVYSKIYINLTPTYSITALLINTSQYL